MSKFKLKMRPSEFTKAFLPVQGQRFLFNDPKCNHNWRNYLVPMYDNMYRTAVAMTARQVEKSTFQSNRHITYSCLIPFFRSVYIAPTGKQVRIFSNDRLKKTIDTSPFLQKYFIDKNSVDQVSEKSFSNKAVIFLGSVFRSADSMRGISTDMLNIDEFQDIISDTIPVLREMLFASDYKIFMATGTPKTEDNHLQKMYNDSTQNIWVIPCKNCGTGNRLDKNPEGVVTEDGMKCKKCRTRITPKDGFWYSLNPLSRTAGFHISQLQTGRLLKKDNWDDFYYNKFLKYPEDKLKNEVFGLSHDKSDKPISMSSLKPICKGEWLDELDLTVTKRSPLYMGVDWGENKGSFNIAVIGGFVDSIFQVFHIKKFDHKEAADPNEVLKQLCRLYEKFGCEIMACDYGAGHKENLRLQKMIGDDRVWEIYHSGNLRDSWKWDEKRFMYITNRTKVMENVIFPIQNGKLMLPKWEYMKREVADDRAYYEDYTSLTSEYSERLGMTKYDHTGPDDITQATVYAKLAAHICEERPIV